MSFTAFFDLLVSHSVALHVDSRQPFEPHHSQYFLHLTYLIILEFDLIQPKQPAQPLNSLQASYLIIVQLDCNPCLLLLIRLLIDTSG